MNKRCSLFLLSMCIMVSPLFAQKKKVMFEVTPAGGYRQDNIKWTTKDGSSQQWKNLQIIDYGLQTQTTFKDRYKIKLDLGFGNVLGGKVNDSRYLAAPGSADPLSNSLNAKGFVFRPNIAFGFNMKPLKCLDLIPQIGYVYDLLKLSAKKSGGNALNSLSNRIQWHGPWLGLDSKMKLSQRWSINAAAKINLAFYNASGNWKFKDNAANNSMTQSGTGYGLTGQLGCKYLVVKSVSVGAEGDIHWNRVTNGTDTRHFSNGETNKSKSLKVNWTSFAGRMTVTKTF